MPPDPRRNPINILTDLGVEDVSAITPVSGGTDTLLWRVQHGGQSSALRLFRREQVETCEREVRAMEAARQAHVPVPAIRARGVWHERPVLLLSWSPGVPLWEAIGQRPWRVLALGRAFGRTQARIHAISMTSDGSDSHASWIEWAGRHDLRLQHGLRQMVRSNLSLLHFDYHPLNVLTDGTRVTAVLDWANARVGDPRADVARTYSILMVEPYTPARQPLRLSLIRRLMARSWRRGYEEVVGPLGEMSWFYAWAGAVMTRDLARRVDDPDSWWQPEHLERIRGWTSSWQERAEKSTRLNL